MSAGAVAAAWLNLVWESTLLGTCVVGLMAAVRLRAPRLRHALLIAALAKCLVPAVLIVYAVEPGEAALRPHGTWTNGLRPLALALSRVVVPVRARDLAPAPTWAALAVWAGVALALLAASLADARRVVREVAAARGVAAGRLVAALARAAQAVRYAGAARLALSERAGSAFAWGGLRPVVVLPAALASALSDAELDAVLRHELAHLRRRDGLAGAVSTLACCLLWPNPLVWWLARAAEREREFACDQEAAVSRGSAEALARALAKAVRIAAAGPASVAPAMSAGDVARRLARLANVRQGREPAWRARLVLVAATFLAVLLAVGANPCLLRTPPAAGALEPLRVGMP